MRIAIGAAAVLLVVAAFVMFGADLRGDDDSTVAGSVRVPDVGGMKNPDAEAALVGAGLRWRFEDSERVRSRPTHGPNHFIDPFDSDTVVEQNPDAGALVTPDTVVVLDTACARSAREGEGVCL